MIHKSLPYMGLFRNKPELNSKIVAAELERYKKLQAEAKEQDMDFQPCLGGYNFIHKTDPSKNYFKPSGGPAESAAIAQGKNE